MEDKSKRIRIVFLKKWGTRKVGDIILAGPSKGNRLIKEGICQLAKKGRPIVQVADIPPATDRAIIEAQTRDAAAAFEEKTKAQDEPAPIDEPVQDEQPAPKRRGRPPKSKEA